MSGGNIKLGEDSVRKVGLVVEVLEPNLADVSPAGNNSLHPTDQNG